MIITNSFRTILWISMCIGMAVGMILFAILYAVMSVALEKLAWKEISVLTPSLKLPKLRAKFN